MSGQGELFAAGDPVPRPPGWNLIANMGGVQGWHIVDHTTPDRGVITSCGIAGRVIDNPARVIVPCTTCGT